MEAVGIDNVTKHQRRLKILVNLGFSIDDAKSWIYKYKTFVNNKTQSGYVCDITFTQYLKLASKAGLTSPAQIGLAMDQYQMGRIGDTGDYIKGNCRFITARQNLNEKFKNGGAAIGYAKSSRTLTGRTKENCVYKRSAAKKLSKPFRLVSPKGKVYTGQNLVEFCESKGLSTAMLMRLCRGDCKQALSGWTGSYTGERGDKPWRP